MKKILIVLPLLALCGFCMTSATITDPQGRVSKISNDRFLWMTGNYNYQFSTNGTWSAVANNSTDDAATVQMMLQTIAAIHP